MIEDIIIEKKIPNNYKIKIYGKKIKNINKGFYFYFFLYKKNETIFEIINPLGEIIYKRIKIKDNEYKNEKLTYEEIYKKINNLKSLYFFKNKIKLEENENQDKNVKQYNRFEKQENIEKKIYYIKDYIKKNNQMLELDLPLIQGNFFDENKKDFLNIIIFQLSLEKKFYINIKKVIKKIKKEIKSEKIEVIIKQSSEDDIEDDTLVFVKKNQDSKITKKIPGNTLLSYDHRHTRIINKNILEINGIIFGFLDEYRIYNEKDFIINNIISVQKLKLALYNSSQKIGKLSNINLDSEEYYFQ